MITIKVGFEGSEVEQRDCRPYFVEVKELVDFGFLVRFDFAVGSLLFTEGAIQMEWK